MTQIELAKEGEALIARIRDLKRERMIDGRSAPAAVWCSNAQMRALHAYGTQYCDPELWRPAADPQRILGWPLRRYDESMSPPAQDGDVVL